MARNTKQTPIPKYVVIALWLIILGVIGAVALIQIQKQSEVDENKREFSTVHKVLEDIQNSTEFSTPIVEWQVDKECRFTPINELNITNETYKEWDCSFTLQRPLVNSDDISSLQDHLAAVISERLGRVRQFSAEDNSVIIETDKGHRCFVSVVPPSHNREEGSVGIGCRGSAYRSWYPNNEHRSVAEGKEAWRTFE